MNVYGLDLSSTCTGLCLPDGQTEHFQPKGDLLERALDTRKWLIDYVWPIDQIDLVIIEAIGTRFVNTAIAIAYVHCQVDELLQGTRVVKVSPAELKKFAVGRGNANKHEMTVAAIRNGWACDSDEGSTDDECDSWHLWTIGKALIREWVVPNTIARSKVVNGLIAREAAA